MVRPLDHATVIQQIDQADKINHNKQMHPEVTRQMAEEEQKQQWIQDQRRTLEIKACERARIHLIDEEKRIERFKRAEEEARIRKFWEEELREEELRREEELKGRNLDVTG